MAIGLFSTDETAMNSLQTDELIYELYDQMFRVAYSKLHDKTDALDVVQEAWIKIITKIDTLKDKQKLMQWAKVIVANTAINLLKRRNVQIAVQIELQYMAPKFISFDKEIEERLLKQAIGECIAELDNETREMFICKYYYNWKDQQIAEVMDMPVGTIKARIHRGKQKLKHKLKEVYANDLLN